LKFAPSHSFLSSLLSPEVSVDKRDKKRIDVIHQRVQKLRQQLAGARQQEDEPGEAKRIEDEIAKLEAESKKLRG
jgi:hypothetical protein